MHQRTLFLIVAMAFVAAPQFALADGDGAVTGVVGGAVAGAVVGGPVGAVVGRQIATVLETRHRPRTVRIDPVALSSQGTRAGPLRTRLMNWRGRQRLVKQSQRLIQRRPHRIPQASQT
jgi:hypothetical protein